MVRAASAAIVLLLALLAFAGCGEGEETSAIPSGGGDTTAEETTETAVEAAPEGCTQVEEPEAKPDGDLARPSAKLDPAKTYTATVATNCGTFGFELDVRAAPKAGASIAHLAEEGFYDGTVFHRIVPDFVIQGGDPTGTGTGGPGYKTVDKPPRDTEYTRGVVAMAKGGNEAPGTAGSQFFVVTGADAGLPPDYAVVGKVTKGMDVVRRIGALGDQSEQPTFTVVIESFRVAES
jgi:cyclophilin family peptidyl-prolyl cis-trans isomerase